MWKGFFQWVGRVQRKEFEFLMVLWRLNQAAWNHLHPDFLLYKIMKLTIKVWPFYLCFLLFEAKFLHMVAKLMQVEL
jgi:uncharacterized membrane protein YhaH (DUF805 family)